ncbi:uncharacterized protein B0I36DRAFT_350157 [Microdochium trichocladiopsis]|uniref:Secreted protein n=1 Tax=Microdochium trichocladiopsis TaxID=1682393 RepID=A0A9P9BPH4_9PEZI|nr:uncharacterized protein B0I36DRAFT_350157 [Microdochium trichocladiopsis]KAH7029247.1 hypothetical protein B0I36DRAFT_350157 [Microdochium trichocladiopsis]
MRELIYIILLLSLGMSMAAKSPRMLQVDQSPSPPSGAQRFVMMDWTGSIVPGGDNYTFRGTIQEIVSQIQHIDPNYAIPSTASGSAMVQTQTERRQTAHTICMAGAAGACPDITKALDGIEYLKGVGGDCGLAAGPATCARVSCSWNCGITWCNDNDHYVSWKCSDLWPSAHRVLDRCTFGAGVWGQTFDEQGFNVIVGFSSC